MLQVWNFSVLGSKRTIVFGLANDSLCQSAPWVETMPAQVEREFRRYLDCGILARGFARAWCGDCGHDFLIAFSGKGRGV